MAVNFFDPPAPWKFTPADFVPFKDRELCERLRKISGKDLEKHPNPDFKIKVMLNPHPVVIGDIFTRIKESDDLNRKLTLILGNPEPETYIPVAQLINYHRVNCRNVHIFAMDEWADEDGNIAPVTYQAGFAHSLLKYLVYQIDEDLRMPLENVHYPTNENIGCYSKMITECGEGGADVCYSSPGWTGHMAFIDPVGGIHLPHHGRIPAAGSPDPQAASADHCPELAARCFRPIGLCGGRSSLCRHHRAVDVANARERIEIHSLLTCGTFASWQRMTSRLVLHGPVTPLVPARCSS